MKAFIKAVGIIAAIIAAACVPRARLRTYAIGQRWFVEIKGAKSRDIRSIIRAVGLYYPPGVQPEDTEPPEPDGTGYETHKK